MAQRDHRLDVSPVSSPRTNTSSPISPVGPVSPLSPDAPGGQHSRTSSASTMPLPAWARQAQSVRSNFPTQGEDWAQRHRSQLADFINQLEAMTSQDIIADLNALHEKQFFIARSPHGQDEARAAKELDELGISFDVMHAPFQEVDHEPWLVVKRMYPHFERSGADPVTLHIHFRKRGHAALDIAHNPQLQFNHVYLECAFTNAAHHKEGDQIKDVYDPSNACSRPLLATHVVKCSGGEFRKENFNFHQGLDKTLLMKPVGHQQYVMLDLVLRLGTRAGRMKLAWAMQRFLAELQKHVTPFQHALPPLLSAVHSEDKLLHAWGMNKLATPWHLNGIEETYASPDEISHDALEKGHNDAKELVHYIGPTEYDQWNSERQTERRKEQRLKKLEAAKRNMNMNLMQQRQRRQGGPSNG